MKLIGDELPHPIAMGYHLVAVQSVGLAWFAIF